MCGSFPSSFGWANTNVGLRSSGGMGPVVACCSPRVLHSHHPSVLLLRPHKLAYQRCNFIGFGVEREVSCFESVNLRVRYVFAVAFRLAEVEREIVLAPEDQQLWLRLL